MTSIHQETDVVIIGAGVAGLALATFLRQAGVACIVLERRTRSHIETVRQRAGVVEGRAVGMFERRGLADRLLGGPVAQAIDYRTDGVSRVFGMAADNGSRGRFCTQQMLVTNLLRVFVDESQGDVRFDVADVTIANEEGARPRVAFTDAAGRQEIACEYVAGCDGNRGVSRSSIPHGVLKKYSHEFGYAWLAALVEAPVTGHPIMGISEHGFVAQLPRGPQRSRYYLQCALSDGLEDWPDARIWDEIRLRMGDASIANALVHDKDIIPLRSVVYAPMQYRNLFLAGDAVHLVPPTGAKGMNLALFDVDVLAGALADAVLRRDRAALDSYSDICLPHLWKYQEFSVWMTETMHDAGDPALRGRFRQMIARARLDTLFDAPSAARLHVAFHRGLA
nr:4-hydroxybenzoate 3-monooxygenase [uncultured Massilia sp.]